jgi:hypothetical protein
MQSACAVFYCHLWPVWLYNNFSRYLITVRFSKKKIIGHKMCVLTFSTTLIGNVSHYSGSSSSVGITTDYGLDGPGIESGGARFFAHVQTGPGTQPPVQWVPGLSRG